MGRSAAGGDRSRDASASCPRLARRACRTRRSICSSSSCGKTGAWVCGATVSLRLRSRMLRAW